MKFSINMCRGSILDVIKLAEENNLLIESIEQGLINDDMMNVKVKFFMENGVNDVENFVKLIKENHDLNSCELV